MYCCEMGGPFRIASPGDIVDTAGHLLQISAGTKGAPAPVKTATSWTSSALSKALRAPGRLIVTMVTGPWLSTNILPSAYCRMPLVPLVAKLFARGGAGQGGHYAADRQGQIAQKAQRHGLHGYAPVDQPA